MQMMDPDNDQLMSQQQMHESALPPLHLLLVRIPNHGSSSNFVSCRCMRAFKRELIWSWSGLQMMDPDDGQILHQQRVHESALVKIEPRVHGMGMQPQEIAEDVTLTFANAVARISSLEVCWGQARV